MAIQQVQTMIVAVNASPTAAGKQAWNVILSDGTELRAWEPHEAQKAMAFLNIPSLVTFTENPSKDGRFTNRGFKDATSTPVPNGASPSFPPNFDPQSGQALPPTPAMPLPASGVAVSAPPSVQTTPSLKDTFINRQSAAKSATAYLAPMIAAGVPFGEAIPYLYKLTRELEEYISTGKIGPEENAVVEASKAPWED